MSSSSASWTFAILSISILVLLVLLPPAEAEARRGAGRRSNFNTTATEGRLKTKSGKFLSVFQVVEFPNSMCNGTDSNSQGTCYTAEECETRDGRASGTCADGYGVCCVFTIGCGGMSRENVTVFESKGDEQEGGCLATVCKVNDNICQVRLDFNSFSLAGPSTISVSTALDLVTGDLMFNRRRTCDTDSFAVVSPGVAAPPVLCGNNKGEHMYVDFVSDCITLAVNVGPGSDADWAVRVSQYPCDFSNLAPSGCTQYIFGEPEGDIQSYNFKGNDHLASQNQKICIRREAGNCRICYTIDQPNDFQLSGDDEEGVAIKGTESACCGHKDNNEGYDCLIIPQPSAFVSDETATKVLSYSEYCGTKVTFKSFVENENPTSICSRRVPFEVSFMTDQVEMAEDEQKEGGRSQAGFRLAYVQDSQGC